QTEPGGESSSSGPIAEEIDLSMFVSDSEAMEKEALAPASPAFVQEPVAPTNGHNGNGNGNGASPYKVNVSYTDSLLGHRRGDVALDTFVKQEEAPAQPFIIQKETGPLHADLIVKFNTSDLLHNTMFDAAPHTQPVAPEGTEELLDTLVSNLD